MNNEVVVGNGGSTTSNSIGGGILAYTGTISVSKAMFKNNSADFGGVFFVADGTVFQLCAHKQQSHPTRWSVAVAISTLTLTNTSIFDNFESKNIIYVASS